MKEILINKIDKLETTEEKYNAAREFLQELILQILDRRGYFGNLAFVGGTALRILYNLQRFSEDLDFCLVNERGFNFSALLEGIKKDLDLNGFEIEAFRGIKERTVFNEFIRFKGLLYNIGLTSHRNEKLFIKMEIDTKPPSGYGLEISMVNKDFLFKVQNYDLPSLFASKLHAFLFRKYAKGRDYYDLLWFLSRKTPVNYELLSIAAQQTEGKGFQLDKTNLKKQLIAKIEKTNFSHVLNDVILFLSKKEESEYFKKDYFLSVVEKGI